MITVNELKPTELQDWDDYVEHHPESTFFHLSGWKEVLEAAMGHKTHYLVARDNGSIVGVLPIARVKSMLFGDSLVSLPFCVYGGVVSNCEASESALIAAACQLADQCKVDYLELRNQKQFPLDWPQKTLHCTFKKAIDESDDVNMKAIPRKQRAMVRKGMKFGLTSHIQADLNDFIFCFEQSYRNLGTPALSRKYFNILSQIFGERMDVLTICNENKPISSVLSFYFKGEVLPYYGGGTKNARTYAANDFMYWSLMQHAVKKGCRSFDFGRSKMNTGAYYFKKNWGFEPTPLHYQFYLVNAEALPDINPLNPKYRVFINLWKRMPLSLARLIGPPISKYLG